MVIDLNLFLTTALAVIVLLVGDYVKKRVEILRKFCIPIPVEDLFLQFWYQLVIVHNYLHSSLILPSVMYLCLRFIQV